jgi:hypothetical protein
MKFLNSQQLAFILDIKKEDARAKMCVAWSSSKGEENKADWNFKGKIVDPYPLAMPIEILSKGLNLPTLQQSVDDIENNYLIRPATLKWILCDYPEKLVLKAKEEGTKPKLAIPPALRSMLPTATIEIIFEEWKKRYPQFRPEEKKEEVHG